MMFSQINSISGKGFALLCIASAFLSAAMVQPAAAQTPVALVPTRIIYPGEMLTADHVKPVDVTNPNITDGYASEVAQIDGMISKQTLLPGRTIPISALREPALVTRGTNVRLIVSVGKLTLSASGTPMTDGAMGEVIRVRNIDSGVIVNGTVMQDGSVQVMAK